uniref:Uncharacterized protein n=1 Tax=Anguilla anguilla TaxID=7936 RepID=A0A0E9R1C7_ANGAN
MAYVLFRIIFVHDPYAIFQN